MLVTVRWPGARMAPTSSTSAWRQPRSRRSGAKHRITAAKRDGRRGMVDVLWPGRPSLVLQPRLSVMPASKGAGHADDRRCREMGPGAGGVGGADRASLRPGRAAAARPGLFAWLAGSLGAQERLAAGRGRR